MNERTKESSVAIVFVSKGLKSLHQYYNSGFQCSSTNLCGEELRDSRKQVQLQLENCIFKKMIFVNYGLHISLKRDNEFLTCQVLFIEDNKLFFSAIKAATLEVKSSHSRGTTTTG